MNHPRPGISRGNNYTTLSILCKVWECVQEIPVWVWGRRSHWRSCGWSTRSARLMDKPWAEFPSGSELAPAPQWPPGPLPPSCTPAYLERNRERENKSNFIFGGYYVDKYNYIYFSGWSLSANEKRFLQCSVHMINSCKYNTALIVEPSNELSKSWHTMMSLNQPLLPMSM